MAGELGIFTVNDPAEFDTFARGGPIADWLGEMLVGMATRDQDEATRANQIAQIALNDFAVHLDLST